VCEAGLPIELWLDERTEGQRRAAEAVLAIVRGIPGLIVEAVTVGILIKRERTIVEMRPKTKWLDLSFITTAHIASDRIARTIPLTTGTAYFVHLRDDSDVDRELRGWLTAALRPSARTSAPDRPRRGPATPRRARSSRGARRA
jgi:hypothetical protein